MSNPKKKLFGSDNAVLLIGFIIIVCIWASTIFAIPIVSSFITNRSDECAAMKASKTSNELELNSLACQSVLSKYGATGDLFGSVTSLFSALGLFAVAATLHIEAKARRGQHKPFVVAQLRDPGFSTQSPNLVDYNSISLTIPLTIKNVGEPAINVRVQVRMRIGDKVFDVCEHTLDMPLVKDLAGDDITVVTNVQGEVYRSFVEALSIEDEAVAANPAKAPVIFVLNILYTNLAGVNWVTKTEYSLSTLNVGDRTRFVHLLSIKERVEEEWLNRSVALIAVAVKGSWSYGEDVSSDRTA
jgi:hypothetical protein